LLCGVTASSPRSAPRSRIVSLWACSTTFRYEARRLSDGARPNGEARLRVWVRPADVTPLIEHAPPIKCEHGDPIESIWVTRVDWRPEPEYSEERDGVSAVVHGPHDVLRWLAYDVDAVWT
jgi:hypothetical protein